MARFTRFLLSMAIIFAALTASAIPGNQFKRSSMTATTQKGPDFAFPDRVVEQSETMLDKALATRDSKKVVTALIDITLAKAAVSSDRMPAAIDTIATIRDNSSDPALKAMLNLLLARIYSDIYDTDRWKYNQRDLPLDPLPDDYTLWSGKQFNKKITSLVDASLVDAEALKRIPLKEWTGPVVADKTTLVCYPTLYDFIASSAIDYLEDCMPDDCYLPQAYLSRANVYVGRRFNLSSPEVTKILSIYADLLRFHENDPAPFICVDLNRIDFVAEHVYSDDFYDSNDAAADLKRELYERFRDNEYSGDVLYNLFTPSPSIANDDNAESNRYCRWYYDALVRNIDRFPAYYGRNCLKNRLSNMQRRSVTVKIPECVAPGSPVKIIMESTNVPSAKINIYDVSSSPVGDLNYNYQPSVAHKLVKSIPVSFSGEVPFCEQKTVEYSFPTEGNYIAVPVIDGVKEKKISCSKIHVTRLALSASSYMEGQLWVVDPVDGAPVGDVTLSTYNERRNVPEVKVIGKTDERGSLAFSSDKWCKIIASKGTDRYAEPLSLWYMNLYNPAEKWIPRIAGYTSLALYHPGDSVEWVAVAYEYRGDDRRVCANKKMTAILRNASYEPVDTIDLVTDDFGRIHGTFDIPSGSMTGRFSINFENGSIGFMVSDYKLPTFMVTTLPAEKDVPVKGAVTLRGKVMTYSGFPVSDARVTVDLSASRAIRWWWHDAGLVSFYATEVTTGADGTFSTEIPAGIMENSPFPNGLYTARFTALSATGESQESSLRFVTGTRYDFDTNLKQAYDISNPVKLDVKLVDYTDSVVSLPVNWRLVAGKDTVAAGKFDGPDPVIDFAGVKSGEYELIMSTVDGSLADKDEWTVVLYRPSDALSPVPDRVLWSPVSTLSIEKGKDASWLYAVGYDTHLLVTVWTPGRVIEQKWVEAKAGMHRLPVTLPADVDEATLNVAATADYKSTNINVTLKSTVPQPAIAIEMESFRDRIVPGTDETWTVRVKDLSGGVRAAVILDMYNQALDALEKQQWSFNPTRGYSPGYSWNQSGLSGSVSSSVNVPAAKILKCIGLEQPELQTWNYSFGTYLPSRFVRHLSGRVSGLTAEYTTGDFDAGTDDLNVVREHKAEVTVESASYDAAAPKVLNSVVYEIQTPDIYEPFSYRDGETPLAFFRPMLSTDADGRLTFSFTVPNANTTWSFNAIAFTDSLLTAKTSMNVLANKPVMVQPNLPRFLRTGDRAEILASVMNNSDTVQSVHTVIDIFDAVTGNVTASFGHDNVIEPQKSATVPVTVTAPVDAAFIGYRVKSSTATFADGEQSLIPVKPSVTPVIETMPFYMQPSSASFSMKLPDMPADARVSLQFCENPAWYVVTALPGILDLEPSTANQAAASIFSAAIADGLLKSNPAIASALREWEQSDRSDSTLVSMLERNADLKIVLLNATPWMMDARSDTERMTRLSLLFDRKQIDKVYSSSISLLKRLQYDGGGWKWYDKSMSASMWATENVLLMMGRLGRMGYLPDNRDLSSMISDALKWLDSEVAAAYKKNPDGDFTLYTYLRTLFPDVAQSVGARAASDAMTQRIVARWKDGSVFYKAVYAQILVARNYKSVASQIIESLRQYAETSPTRGMWWPSLDRMTFWSMDKVGATSVVLDAFNAVQPGCPDIDLIRQWLILQKETTDWGTSVTATEVIASILSSSSRWIEPATGGAVVKIGETPVVPDKIEKITGYFRTDISALNPSGAQLSVEKSGDYPSWGAVYCQYTGLMTSVKAAGCDDVTIAKKLLLVNSATDGVTVENQTGALAVGDKVRVQLTIKVERDMDYVAIVDDRPACFEPVEQLPQPIFTEGIYFYRENRDSATRIFIDHLPKGTYLLNYDMWVNNAGEYASGIATIQSQYAPQMTAHSAGDEIKVDPVNNK